MAKTKGVYWVRILYECPICREPWTEFLSYTHPNKRFWWIGRRYKLNNKPIQNAYDVPCPTCGDTWELYMRQPRILDFNEGGVEQIEAEEAEEVGED